MNHHNTSQDRLSERNEHIWDFVDDSPDPHFVFARRRYEIREVVDTGIFVRTNDEKHTERLQKAHIPAQKTEKQCTITISIQPDTKT